MVRFVAKITTPPGDMYIGMKEKWVIVTITVWTLGEHRKVGIRCLEGLCPAADSTWETGTGQGKSDPPSRMLEKQIWNMTPHRNTHGGRSRPQTKSGK